MNIKRLAGLAGLLICLMVVFAGTAAAAADKWTSVRSRNFTLVGDASEAQIRAVASDLEQFRNGFAQVFAHAAKASTVPVTVVVFKNDDSFRPFKPLAGGKPAEISADFQISEDVDYLAVTAGVPIPRSVYHRYVHELMKDMPVTLPLWFTEGVAEFYSALEISVKDKKYRIGQAIPDHVDVLRKNPLMPFGELFKIDQDSPQYDEARMKGIYYAESWALANYLIVGQSGKRQPDLAKFLNLLAADKPADASFQEAFGLDYDALQQELEKYIHDRQAWPSQDLPLKDKSEIDKEIKVRALSDAETEFYSGDLLLHVGRLVDAEAHLKQSVALNPGMSEAYAALGMVRYRVDELPDALNFLKRALATDSKSYIAYYDYAFVLDKSGNNILDELDAKRSALGKAIELAPQYVPAYELLAYLNLTADIDYDGTLELLQKARTYVPGNPNLRFLVAQVMVKKKDFDTAGKILQTLVGNSSLDPALRQSARVLVSFMARSQENEPAMAAGSDPARTPARAASAVAPEPPTPVAPQAPVATQSTAKRSELELVSPQKSRPDGTRVTGVLTLVDCRNGLTLTVKAGSQTLALHTDTPSQVQFYSSNPSINTSIQCGPTAGAGIPVIVTYRPGPGGANAGEPLFVEFVERF